jgi:pimeloyl-ACP methyl ester carboxylesterase
VLRGTVLAAAALALAGCGGGHARPRIVKARSLPGSYVAADGHRVYFDCEGSRSPTVVFLTGWGVDASTSWASVFDAISHDTRACVYDRLGLGFTTARPNGVRDAHDQERELEQLLANAGIPGPYVLVGHSWGGALARLYAGTHDDVKGVVFLDASVPGQETAIPRALPPKRANEPQVVTELRQPFPAPLVAPEHLAWKRSLREVGRVTDLGDRPILVVTAGRTFVAVPPVERVWFRLQDRLAAISTRRVHVTVPDSGHFVMEEAPSVAIKAIRADVQAVRHGRLPSCADLFNGTTVFCVS